MSIYLYASIYLYTVLYGHKHLLKGKKYLYHKTGVYMLETETFWEWNHFYLDTFKVFCPKMCFTFTKITSVNPNLNVGYTVLLRKS